MTNTIIKVAPATTGQRPQIIELLQQNDLPSSDMPDVLSNFIVATNGDVVVGVIGLEQYGPFGLLRSMVVKAPYRNQHIATRLVQQVEQTASMQGMTSIYLLTETARHYFEKKGYNIVERDRVPRPITGSTEYSHLCPVSAVVMKKDIVPN